MGFTRFGGAVLSLAAYLACEACAGTRPGTPEPANAGPADAARGINEAAPRPAAANDDGGAAPAQAERVTQVVPKPVTGVPVTPALPPPSVSTSIGSPSNGHLQGGVPLPTSAPGLRYNDRRPENARYATVEVI